LVGNWGGRGGANAPDKKDNCCGNYEATESHKKSFFM
jgi:hypothetical protein